MKIIITEKKTQIINRKHKNNIIPEAKESDGAIYEIEIFQSVCRITINVGPHAEYGRLHRLYVSFFASSFDFLDAMPCVREYVTMAMIDFSLRLPTYYPPIRKLLCRLFVEYSISSSFQWATAINIIL